MWRICFATPKVLSIFARNIIRRTMKKQIWLIVLLLSVQFILFSQENKAVANTKPRHIGAVRTDKIIKIDGVLDDIAWQNAPIAQDFIQQELTPGAPSCQRSEVRILYDDQAIYIGAMLFDTKPDSILKELSARDQDSNSDWFAFGVDAYQGGNDGSVFGISPTNVQYDAKNSNDNDDSTWDAVWESATKITEKGWLVEFKIPYAAVRFPNKKNQNWNINFGRHIRRVRETSFWNPVKPDVTGFLTQFGVWEGLSDVRAPIRLSATPFIASYFENYYDKNASPRSSWARSLNGGMDVKYGINDAFTLDMTLIPDFGQVQSDNNIVNLSPFEVRFQENRPFFTEGTELFNKGDLFYSRRIGSPPLHYEEVENNLKVGEKIVTNPTKTQLFNATKISGRNAKGLGIGFFNATAGSSYAVVETADGTRRNIQTNPLTNYNVLIFDQNLPNNSFVTLLNTNVARSGSDYDADVAGAQFMLRNKKNSYAVSGTGAYSQRFYSKNNIDDGYKYLLQVAKTNGNFTYSLSRNVESNTYNPNDLGYLESNNKQEWLANAQYNIYKPFGKFTSMSAQMSSRHTKIFRPNVFATWSLGGNIFLLTKKIFGFGGFFSANPVTGFDYFEPRREDFSLFYIFPKNYLVGGFISSDYRKRVALDVEVFYQTFDQSGRKTAKLGVSPRFRLNDHCSFILNNDNQFLSNDVGFTTPQSAAVGFDDLPSRAVVFAHRNQIISENTFSGKYTFNNKMGLTLRLRHYWTRLNFRRFDELGTDGRLYATPYSGKNADGTSAHDATFNIFNLDLVYLWRFAPGSDLSVVWKNSIFSSNRRLSDSYFSQLGRLFAEPQTNSLSFKIIYFLDYLTLTKKHKR